MTWRMWVIIFLSVGPYVAMAFVVGRMIAVGSREPGMAEMALNEEGGE